ncbi:MAG: OmpA family protein [Magnetococcales bacterium]|nr:OmpA family protein [Magnetococcales bacterium]
MAVAKKCPECKKGTPLWFISWADMVTLLLCLFVIIVAYSSTSAAKFKEVAGSMKDAFGVQKAQRISPILAGYELIGMEFNQEVKLVELVERVRMVMSEMVDNGSAEVVETEAGFMITVKKDKMFEDNSIKLRKEVEPTLQEIANLVSSMPNQIQIAGYTDGSSQDPTSPFASHWLRAAGYASSVADYLTSRGGIPAQRMQVTSHGAYVGAPQQGALTGVENRVEITILRLTGPGGGSGGDDGGQRTGSTSDDPTSPSQ